MKLRDLWVEINVLHKTAVFLRQCFADPVSRASLSDAKEKNSKFARNILCIDIMEGQSLNKGSKGKQNSIESLVMLYCERETFALQKIPECVEKIDKKLQQALGREPSNLLEMVRTIILERLTRKPKKKRPAIAPPKLLEWVECMDPEIELADL